MRKPFVLLLIATYILFGVALFMLLRTNNQALMMLSQQQQPVQAPVKKVPTLPPGAVKISECIPTEGEHWVRPQDIPTGPYYSVYNGKVMSIEYMMKTSDLPGEKTAKMQLPELEKYMKDNNYNLNDLIVHNDKHFPLDPAEYRNFSIHWSAPHAGFTEPHIDLHIFMADHAELMEICPDAGIESVYSPEVIQTIQENNIPMPGPGAPETP